MPYNVTQTPESTYPPASGPSGPPPGWYPDPFAPDSSQRWWNGRDWTDHEGPLSADVLPWPESSAAEPPLPDFWTRLRRSSVDRSAGTNAASSMAIATLILGVLTAFIPGPTGIALSAMCLVAAVVWGVIGAVRAIRWGPGLIRSVLAVVIGTILLLLETAGLITAIALFGWL